MQKCFYCNKKTESSLAVEFPKDRETFASCGEDCAAKIRDFVAFTERVKIFFAIGMVVPILLIVACMVTAFFSVVLTAALLSVGWFSLGLTIFLFPLVTPQTFGLLGIRKSVILAKAIGILIMLSTPVLAFLAVL